MVNIPKNGTISDKIQQCILIRPGVSTLLSALKRADSEQISLFLYYLLICNIFSERTGSKY